MQGSLSINTRYSYPWIYSWLPAKLPGLSTDKNTMVSLQTVSNFSWLVWPAFFSSRCQPPPLPFRTRQTTDPRPLRPQKRRPPGISWAVGIFHYYTTEARHSTGSFNPVCMLQTNGMVQPTLPVRKRWKQTQSSSLNAFSQPSPLFFFNTAMQIWQWHSLALLRPR
jgi:hypothetical protein